MSAIMDISGLHLRYRVFHPDFDAEKSYLALAYIDYGESAWSQLLFINERGMTFAVSVEHTVCVSRSVISNDYVPPLWRALQDNEQKEAAKSRLKKGRVQWDTSEGTANGDC